MIDGRFFGEKIPSNIVFFAACNPYRKKRQSIKRVKSGIKKNSNCFAKLQFPSNINPYSNYNYECASISKFLTMYDKFN